MKLNYHSEDYQQLDYKEPISYLPCVIRKIETKESDKDWKKFVESNWESAEPGCFNAGITNKQGYRKLEVQSHG